METKAIIKGKQVIVNIQNSQIGGCYPRIFIEVMPGKDYRNVDLTLCAVFGMPAENWNDWDEEATVVEPTELAENAGLPLSVIEELVETVSN